MPGIMTTGSFSKLLWPGIKKIYGDTYNEYPQEWSDIFDKTTSDKAYEEYVGTSMFGLAPIKTQGGSIAYDQAQQGFITRLTNIVYALGFVITREMYDDNQYGDFIKRFSKALAFSMRQTKEIVCANVLNRAFTSGYTGGDGSVMCVSTHPNVAGGTWSNVLSVASDLTGDALESACIQIMGFQDDRGKTISAMPQKLIISVNDLFNAERILKSSLEYDTANNAVNALKSKGVFPGGIAVNHYLTDADAWFIKTNVPDGLIFQERDADDFSPAPENDFDTENAKYKARMRFSVGWNDPRGILGSAGA
jgi:Mu-like prophage major head subunit gpT